MPDRPRVRAAREGDSGAIARIYNEGIEDRVATFETTPKTEADVHELMESERLLLVAELQGAISGFVKVTPYDDAHPYYSGIGEATLYVERRARRSGVGLALMLELSRAAERIGLYKLIGKIFASNEASLALVERCGWRVVGVHRRHGRLDGEWKDVVLVELLLGPAAGGAPPSAPRPPFTVGDG